jgi:tetratricopeptide (TPR) repeat protein
MRVCRWVGWALALLVVVGFAGTARADLAQQARDLYVKGKQAYEQAKYEEAYDNFKQAYVLSQQPALLYNIASALQGLRRPHDAAEALRSYVKQVPGDPDRPAIEERIASLEDAQRLLDKDRAATEPKPQAPAPAAEPLNPPAPTAPPAPVATSAAPSGTSAERGRTEERAGIGVAVSGGVLVVGGLVASLLAKGNSDAVAAASRSGAMFNPAQERAGHAEDVASYVLYGIGAAAVVGGAAVAIVGHRARRAAARAQLAPAVAPGRAVLSVSGSF